MALRSPGIYDIPLAEYVADPAPEPSLSSSIAHAMLTKSPLHAWQKHPRLNPHYRSEEANKFDIGTAAHAIVLEHDRSGIVVIEADDWRKKEAKEARETARASGKVPVLREQMDEIEAMANVAEETIASSELADAFGDGKPEQTLIWQESDIWLRSRPDWLPNDNRIVIDYKTTAGSAEPNAWARGPMISQGFDLQAALGLRGIKALKQLHNCRFVFMVQEIEPPYAMSFVGLSQVFIALAELKLQQAIMLWQRCMQTCNWPSYGSRIIDVDPPMWAFNDYESDIEWSAK